MNISHWFYILALVVYIIQRVHPDTNLRLKRKTCNPNIKFDLCKSDSSNSNPMWNLYGSIMNVLEIDVVPGCKGSHFEIVWELRNKKTKSLVKKFEGFRDKMALIVDTGVLIPGDYILTVKVTEKASKKASGTRSADCWIRSIVSSPTALIKGGVGISALRNEAVTFDGSYSVEGANKNIKYSWKCKTISGSYNDCNKLTNRKGKAVSMKIEANVGTEYIITLTLSSDGASDSMSQSVVVVDSDSPKFELRCIKNCMEAGSMFSNILVPIFFRILCEKNCEKITYKWTVSKNGKPMSPDKAKYKFNTEKLYLTKGMAYGDMIDISATVRNAKNKEAVAKRKFKLANDLVPKMSCAVNPTKGTSLVTNFNVKCSIANVNIPLLYYLIQITKISNVRRATQLAFGSVPEFVTKIAADGGGGTEELQVITEDESKVTSVLPLKVEVTSFLDKSDGSSAIAKLIDIYDGKTSYTNSVKSMFKYAQYAKAVQVMQALLSEQKQIPDSKHINKLKNKFLIKIMEDLLNKLPSEPLDIVLLVHFIAQLVGPSGEPMNVNFAKLKSELCKKLSEAVNNIVQKSHRPYTYYFSMINIKTYLSDCAGYIIIEDFAKRAGFDIEKPKPILNHPTLKEDYPNYKDDVPDSSAADHKQITMDALETLKHSGHAFARTIAPGEPVPINSLFVSISSSYANFLSKKLYTNADTAVMLPETLGLDDEDEVRIVYTSFKKQSFSIQMNEKVIQTSIINLNIFTNNGTLRETKYPINYFFTIHKTADTKMYSGEVTVPTKEKDWVPEIIDLNITVIRIEVRNGSKLFARFYNITPVKEILVVTTKFRRPQLKDFKGAKIIKNEGLISSSVSHEDCWYYVAILPKKEDAFKKEIQLRQEEIEDAQLRLRFGGDYSLDMNSGEQTGFRVTYNYVITTQSCMEWRDKEWRKANCELLNADKGHMICRCKVVTTMAGQEYALPHKLDGIKNIKFLIKLQLHYIIYAATAIVVGLYCIAMCFAFVRAQARRTMYFLGDNLKDERYAYLIIVRTGSWVGSGTTSNITIKLHGIKNESKAHVLNYPDPDKEILQQSNEDWFILTTEKHLGQIKHIQLWYDCIGHRTHWYCHDVRIYDLQTKESWHFKVANRFTVSTNDKHHIIVKLNVGGAAENKSLTIHRFFKSIRLSFGANHTWNIFTRSDDRSFTYIERITVVLSHILCVYAFGLLICYRPTVRIKDGLTPNHFDSHVRIIMNSMFVAILAFTVNLSFVILFRNMRRTSGVFHFQAIHKFFPSYVKYVAWILLIGTILTAIIYLIVCGFWISFAASSVWLTVTAIALIMEIFILENLYIIFTIFIDRHLPENWRPSINYYFEAIITEAEIQRKMLYNKLGIYGLRPYLTHLYKPLSKTTFIEKKRREGTKQAIATSLFDMVIFILYTSLLYILLSLNMNHMSVNSSEHLKDMIEHGHFAPFGGIKTVCDTETLYKYLNETFIPTVHPMNWYGNWNVSDPGLMADFSTKVLGVARIRQQRVRENSCTLTKFMRDLNITKCNPEYSTAKASTKDQNKDSSRWSYQNNKDTNQPIVFGNAHTYSGNGFMSNLGRTINNAYFMVKSLRDDKWIDELTRVVFLEFWMYNVNSNLFSTVTVTFERSATQYIMSEVQVFTGTLIYANMSVRLVAVSIFTIFVVIISKQAYNYIERLIITRLRYLKKVINLLETCVHILNVCVIYLFLARDSMAVELFRKLETSKQTEFVPYFNVVSFYDTTSVITATLIAAAIVRLWHFMRFILIFRIIERTLVTSFNAIMGVLVYTFIILVMFGLSGHVMFGFFYNDFRTITKTFFTYFRLAFNFNQNVDYKILFDYYPFLSYLHLSLYHIAAIVLLKLYATVLIIYYEDSNKYYSNIDLGYTVKNYLSGEWHYFTELWRRRFRSMRLRAGQDFFIPDEQKVCPKADAHRYADCVIISDKKLRTMALIARGVIRKLHSKENPHIFKDDNDLMNRIVLNKIHDENDDDSGKIFFKVETEAGKLKFVSDVKILQMEYIVNCLLSQRKETVQVDEEKLMIQDHRSLKRIERVQAALDKIKLIINNINVVPVPRRKRSERV